MPERREARRLGRQGPRAKEAGRPREAGKGEETDAPGPPEKNSPADPLVLAQRDPSGTSHPTTVTQ